MKRDGPTAAVFIVLVAAEFVLVVLSVLMQVFPEDAYVASEEGSILMATGATFGVFAWLMIRPFTYRAKHPVAITILTACVVGAPLILGACITFFEHRDAELDGGVLAGLILIVPVLTIICFRLGWLCSNGAVAVDALPFRVLAVSGLVILGISAASAPESESRPPSIEAIENEARSHRDRLKWISQKPFKWWPRLINQSVLLQDYWRSADGQFPNLAQPQKVRQLDSMEEWDRAPDGAILTGDATSSGDGTIVLVGYRGTWLMNSIDANASAENYIAFACKGEFCNRFMPWDGKWMSVPSESGVCSGSPGKRDSWCLFAIRDKKLVGEYGRLDSRVEKRADTAIRNAGRNGLVKTDQGVIVASSGTKVRRSAIREP